jgi:hypothetical protein
VAWINLYRQCVIAAPAIVTSIDCDMLVCMLHCSVGVGLCFCCQMLALLKLGKVIQTAVASPLLSIPSSRHHSVHHQAGLPGDLAQQQQQQQQKQYKQGQDRMSNCIRRRPGIYDGDFAVGCGCEANKRRKEGVLRAAASHCMLTVNMLCKGTPQINRTAGWCTNVQGCTLPSKSAYAHL